MEYYVTQPKDYWIAQNAINITLNALGDKNRIQCSVVSGAVIMCFLEDVKPASQGGDPENGDGLYYGVNHEPKRWPLSISPTYFNTDSHKYVYVAIPRSEAVGTQAVIVFPSEELDIYGRARRLLTNNETGEPLLDEDGEQQVSYEQIGSTDYFYIYLNGIISAPAVNAATNREERGWERAITDWGKLETAQGREERQNTNEWFSYSQVNQVVTFLKEIAMGVGSSFRNLILNHKNLTDVATSDMAYTDSDTMVATPGYVEKHFLSKSHDDSTPYSLTVGGILRAVTGYITSLYSNLVQSTNYTGDGIADTGYRLTADHNGHSKLTIDEIYVRMKAVFESLEVRERTYTGGDQIWSCAGNRVVRVDYLGNAETADHVPQMVNVHADGRPEGTGEGDVYSVPVPGDTYGYSDVKVPWLLRQMPLLARAKVFARYRKVRIVINEPAGSSANRAAAAESPLANIRRARCYFLAKDDDMEVHNWWRINDLARCQTMNLANATRQTYISGEDQKAGNIFWWRKVIGVSYEPVTLDDGKQYHYFDVSFDYEYEKEHPEVMVTSVMEGSDIPAAQDSVVQFGNTIIEGRMNLMMMEVNGSDAVGYNPTTDAPCLKAYRGVYCFDLNKSWVGGNARKMMLSPKSGYEFYGPNFKQVTEYDVVPVPVDRGLWLDITPTRDDYREHAMVRKCYYYNKVSHNGSYWLCSIVDGAHWVDGNGDYISDAAYSALTEEQKALCSRKQNYTIEEPSANSIDWTEVVSKGGKGEKGSFKSRVFCRDNSRPDTPESNTPEGTTYNTYDNPVPPPVTGQPTWTDGIPQGTAILWSSVCTFYADGTNSGWSTPAPETDTETLDIEFSPNNTQPADPVGTAANKDTTEIINARQEQGWYDPSRLPAGQQMIYRAERKIKNGVYNGDWVVTRIYGESGDAAPYYVEDYGIGASRTSHSDISSWSSSQPSPTTQKPYVWKRTRLYNPNTQTYGTATYVCLTGERGVNGKDGWMVTANPANVIITQSLNNNTSSFSSATVSFTAKKGGTNATIASIGTPTSSEFVVSKSGNTVIVSRPQTHGSSAEYYTEGSFKVNVNVTDPDTGNTVTFSDFTVLCYANLLGTWKESVEGGVKTVVAEVVTYDFLDGKLTKNGRTYTQTASAAGNYENWSSSSNTSVGSRRWMNEHINTAEANINTVKRSVRNVNFLKGLEDGSGWTDFESFEPEYSIFQSFCVFLCDNGMNVNSPIVELPAGIYTASAYGWENVSQINGVTLYVMYRDNQGRERTIGYNRTEDVQGGLMKYTFTLLEARKVFLRFAEDNDESFCISEPKIEAGTEVTEWESSTMSQIKQTADEIDLSIRNDLGDTGININGSNKKITAKANNFEIQNSSGSKTFEIDANGNLKSNGNAQFEGKVKATSGVFTGTVAANLFYGRTLTVTTSPYTIDPSTNPYNMYLYNNITTDRQLYLPNAATYDGLEINIFIVPPMTGISKIVRVYAGSEKIQAMNNYHIAKDDYSDNGIVIRGYDADASLFTASYVVLRAGVKYIFKSINGTWYVLDGLCNSSDS